MKEGIIFTSGEVTKGEIKISRRIQILKQAVVILNKSGKWLILLAIICGLFLFWPVIREEIRYSLVQTPLGKSFVKVANTEVKVEIIDPQTAEKRLKTDWIVPDNNYSIYIKKINAKSRIIGNVDPGDRNGYMAALKNGVAEASGLSHPGERGTTYLFAHSVGSRADFARYNAVFYLLNKLEKGDSVEVVYRNKLYKYLVDSREVISATDLKYLLPQKEEEKLVMQTCYPPGTSWRRLIVVAKRAT